MRVDAEFFSKRHLRVAALLGKARKESIQELTQVSDGNHFAIADEFTDAGVPYYRGQNVVGHFFVEQSAPYFITERAYRAEHMKRSHLLRGDVLLSIVGTIGEASLVTSEAPATCSCKLAILRPRQISPQYLAVFLRSEMGRSQTARFTRGAVQMGLLLEDMDQLFVTRFSEGFEGNVSALVIKAQQELDDARRWAEEAENILISALGLRDWQPPEPLTYTLSARQALGSRRLDAEYFAPRVRGLLDRLGASGRSVRDVAPTRREKFVPAREGEFDYIEISDVHGDGTVGSTRLAQSDAPSRATQFVRAGDVITSTVRPIRRLSALIFPAQAGSVCSSGFVVLEPRAIAPEVLLTYLRLPLVCELMDLHTSASMYPAISETDLLRLPFPDIDAVASGTIVSAVRSAHTARQRARELLQTAQRTVEIAIEDSEDAALPYLITERL